MYTQLYKMAQDKMSYIISEAVTRVEGELGQFAADVKSVAYFFSYDKYAQQYMLEENPMNRLSLSSIVASLLKNIENANADIDEVILVDNENRAIRSGNLKEITVLNIIIKNYIDKNSKDKSLYCTPVLTNNDNEKYVAFILPIYSVVSTSSFNKRIGTGIVLCNIKRIDKIVQNTLLEHGSFLYLFDTRHNLISASMPNSAVISNDKPSGLYDEVVKSRYSDSKRYIYKSKVVNIAGWDIISAIPKDTIAEEYRSINTFCIISIFFLIVVMSLMGLLLNNNINRPISKIVGFLKGVSGDDLHKRLDIDKSPNEIGKIINYINIMLNKTEKMTNEIIESQTVLYKTSVLKKQAELNALQSQINPHFLYNVLDCMRSIALHYGIIDIVEVATSLAKILRYSIKSCDMVMLKDEIECVQNYLNIIFIRYKNKIDVTMNIDPDLLESKTLKMILQPVVENAVYHGLECKKGKGSLVISGGKDAEGSILFVVEDNGIGIKSDILEDLRMRLKENADDYIVNGHEKRSIGLANIHLRIRTAFGESYGISVESIENVNTRVIIHIPTI
jgi:two-component system sensor histidine kinase YesM